MRKYLAAFWLAALIILNYAIPYTVLKGYQKVAGAYLFWPLITLIVALSCFAVVRKWRD